MSLTSAISAATSGLRTAQAGMDVVAQNVANAGSVGYTRRRLDPIQALAGDRTGGVRSGEIGRVLDQVAQKQLRLETSGAAYTSVMADFASALDRLFGQPGGSGSLDGAVNDFTQSLQQLASDAGSYSSRSAALASGNALADRIAGLADGVQALRTQAEGRLATGVARANELLANIATLNGKVAAGIATGAGNPALLDERDRLIGELSGLMDVQAVFGGNGAMSLITSSGLTLVEGGSAVRLSFDAHAALGPNSAYSTDPTQRGVGTIRATTIGGQVTDLVANKMIRSGELAAGLELRDRTLVEAQRQLDELAAGLSRALSDRAVTGTPAGSGATTGFDIDLAGLQAGNAITVDYRDNASTPPGAMRRVILVPTLGGAPAAINPNQTQDPSARVETIDIGSGFAAMIASIGAKLGPGLTVSAVPGSSTAVRILDDGSAGAPDLLGLSAGITETSLSGGQPQLPFFVDSGYSGTAFTGSFEGASHLTGFAQRMKVNAALVADRSKLVVFSTSPATPQGDTTRPQYLVDSLTKASRVFSAASGIGGIAAPYAATVKDFAQRVVETQGANAESAQRLNEGQKVALSVVESRFAEKSGVNVDQEMAQLVQLQTAYGANARVMTAVRDMLDLLLRI